MLEIDSWLKYLVRTDQLTTFVVKGGVCQELGTFIHAFIRTLSL